MDDRRERDRIDEAMRNTAQVPEFAAGD